MSETRSGKTGRREPGHGGRVGSPSSPCHPLARYGRSLPVSLLLIWALAWWPGGGLRAAPALQTTPGAPLAVQGCSELVVNGGFETEGGWELFGVEVPPAYTTARAFAGSRSMRLGITDGPNAAAVNGVRQTLFLPNTAASIVLGFRYLPVHESVPGVDDDLQYVDIYDANTNQKIARPWAGLVNESGWIFFQFDLSGLKGQLIRLEFGVVNDGGGGRTALFLDDVSVLACDVDGTPTSTATPTGPSSPLPTPTGTPSPTATQTPSPTSTPGTPTPLPPAPGCVISGLVQNGSFEEDGPSVPGWILGQDPWPPELVGEGRSGRRSLRLGRPPMPGHPDRKSYSSVRQLIQLPNTALTARLIWYHRSNSQEPAKATASRFEDRQEVILLTTGLDTLRILYRTRRTDDTWQQESRDLTPFLGRSFYIYFNVFNDGNGQQTWMLLDDVSIELCFPGSPTPTGTPSPTATATATPTPGPDATDQASSGPTVPAEEAQAVAGTPEARPRLPLPTVSPTASPAAPAMAVGLPSPSTMNPQATPTSPPPPPASGETAPERAPDLGRWQQSLLIALIVLLSIVLGLLVRRRIRTGSVFTRDGS